MQRFEREGREFDPLRAHQSNQGLGLSVCYRSFSRRIVVKRRDYPRSPVATSMACFRSPSRYGWLPCSFPPRASSLCDCHCLLTTREVSLATMLQRTLTDML